MKVQSGTAYWFSEDGTRLDASFHLSGGRIAKKSVDKSPLGTVALSQASKRVFLGGRFKRVYVDNPESGYLYLTASDMTKSEPFSGVYLSKKHTRNIDLLEIKKGWILISCSGSIGRTVYSNDLFEGQIGTHDLIRVEPDPSVVPPGYLYAFLSSRYGYALLTQGTYGGVIQHIEPYHIAGMPVPLLPESEQQRVHDLVEEASNLRVEGQKKLKLVHDIFSDAINKNYQARKIMVVNADDVCRYQSRLDASYNIGIKDIKKAFSITKLSYKKIEDVFERCYIPNRGKRNYTETGVPYLSTTDISTVNPSKPEKFISVKSADSNYVLVQKDWILIARSGQDILGSVTIVGDAIAGYAVNEHAIRLIICKDKMHPNYIYGLLSSPFGRKYLRTGIFGSAILTINEEYILNLEVPILDNDKVNRIVNLVNDFRQNYDQAIKLENQAISTVESIILSW